MKKFLVVALVGLIEMAAPDLLRARLSPKRSVLDNGLVVVTSEQKALPMVAFHLVIEAGSRFDPSRQEGLANLTSRLLTYGTRRRTALEISEALDFIGASIATGCSEELATVSLTLLKKDLETGLRLLAEILTESTFPLEEIARQKDAVIAAIRAREEDPGEVAQKKFLEALFPQSPYGRPVEGSEESVGRMDRKGLMAFYQQFYRPNRAIMAVVGDVAHEEIIERLSGAFRSWKKREGAKDAAPETSPGEAKLVQVHRDLTQANIIIGHAGVPRGHEDYYAIQVMNYILGGGGFSSRLMESIRNQRGLAYSIYSFFGSDKYAGTFQVGMQTRNETAREAIGIAREQIRRIREKGVSPEELQEAKDYLVGSFPLRLDTNHKVAQFLAQVEYLELGLDYPDRYPQIIRKITQEDVLRAARRYLNPEKLILTVVADLKKAEISKGDQ